MGSEDAGLRRVRQPRGGLQGGYLGHEQLSRFVSLAARGSHRPASRLCRLAPPRQRHLHTSQKCRQHCRHHLRVQPALLPHVVRVRVGGYGERDNTEMHLRFRRLPGILRERLGQGGYAHLLCPSLCVPHRQQLASRVEADRCHERCQREVFRRIGGPEGPSPEESLVCHRHHHHRVRRFRPHYRSSHHVQHVLLWLRFQRH